MSCPRAPTYEPLRQSVEQGWKHRIVPRGEPARAVTSRFLTKLVADFDVAGEVFLNWYWLLSHD